MRLGRENVKNISKHAPWLELSKQTGREGQGSLSADGRAPGLGFR